MKVSFAAFYLVYAETLNWVVPDFHLDVCDFLEDYGTLGLLMMPRGHGKSTILDIYNAWKLFCNSEHLILHQGATDPDAYKVSRGTEQVLERHPLSNLFGIKRHVVRLKSGGFQVVRTFDMVLFTRVAFFQT